MKPTASPNLWRPLRVTVFRNLLIADVISDAGAFMQNLGAAWLMVSLGAGPTYVFPIWPLLLSQTSVRSVIVRFS